MLKRTFAGLALVALILTAPLYLLLFILGFIGVAFERSGHAIQVEASEIIKRINTALSKAYHGLIKMR